MTSPLTIVTFFVIFLNNVFALRKTLEDVNLDLFPDYNFDTIENRYPVENAVNHIIQTGADQARDKNTRKVMDEKYNFDGIPHFEITESNSNSKVSKEIEDAYRMLISMKGVSGVYKRDKHWRTWRLVKYPKFKKLHCFVCLNNDNGDCGGYWNIEERPPQCPYEILSIQNEDKVCYFNFNSESEASDCNQSIANLTADCGDTIVTKWYFTIDYSDSREKPYLPLICSGLDPCEMTTVYEINNNQTKFKIVNKSNDIVYSRVMKKDNKNWACVINCGKVNDNLKTFMPIIDKPLSINLLESAHKAKKREDIPTTRRNFIYTQKHIELNTENYKLANVSKVPKISKRKVQKKSKIKTDQIKNIKKHQVMKYPKHVVHTKYIPRTTTDYRQRNICDYIQCIKNKGADYSYDFSNEQYSNEEDHPYLYYNT